MYKITIQLKNGEVISGLRENNNLHIDPVFIEYFTKATQFYQFHNVAKFNCVMISRNSEEYQAYELQLKKKRDIEPGFFEPARRQNMHGGGKYRTKEDTGTWKKKPPEDGH